MLIEENHIAESGEFIINMGPQHPSTHGVLHLKIWLDGETILKIEPNLGYIHRSVEKICENLSYRQFSFLTSRMDYLSSHINNEACALAVEKAIQIEATPRAKAVRILLAELTRLASHQLWWAAIGLDLGAVTPFFYAFRERELLNDIIEQTCGARLTQNFIIPGGIMQDIHPDFQKRVKEAMQQIKSKFDEYDQLLTGNVIFQQRLKGVGYLSPENAISYGCSGPTARASGISCDVRKKVPYEGYDQLQFNEIVRHEGDCWGRYLVRIAEMRESVSIIEQLIDNIPDGDFQAKTKAVIKLPKGEFYQRVETARGDFGVYLVSDGGNTPYRCKFRSPNLSNLSAIPEIAQGSKIGDLVAIMATVDLVIPDIDR
ncbi:MAG: NADH-quinone oxidoreductase subunit D [Crocinitomicaceae bacterium]|nr:NADH-quinone oxidoreductase subunit D [Crocinitomicaceae bacterium]